MLCYGSMVDLHTHSTHSDGFLDPAALLRFAREAGLTALALTDHDTIGGLAEADAAAAEAGLRFIPGIEIEVAHTGGEFHLLGLGISGSRERLEKTLDSLRRARTRRNLLILERMQDDGVDVEYPEVEALAGGEIIGRPHFARIMVAKGVVKSVDAAFQRFLKPGMPYHVPKESLGLRQATDLIHSAGGKAVIAHPMSLGLSWWELPQRIKAYRDLGVDGLEAYHPGADRRECRRLEKIARSLGLLVTAGSDFHGPYMPGRRIGHSCDGLPIDDVFAAPFL